MGRPHNGRDLVRKGQRTGLGAEAHRQVMDLLHLADQSSNPEIRAAAVRMAEETSRHQRTQQSRVPPTVVVVLGTLIAVTAVSTSWYAIVKHPGTLGREITGMIFAAALLLVGLYALLSGHLSEKSFMDLVGMIWSWFKAKTFGPSPKVASSAEEGKYNSESDTPPPAE
jgi:hypothetical protein